MKKCPKCRIRPYLPHATLFQVSIAPRWSKYIVKYLTQCLLLPEKISKAHRKSIELETKGNEMITNSYTKRGKYKKLRLCVMEVEYVQVFKQAHVGLSRSHFLADAIAKATMTTRLWWLTLFMMLHNF